jgi:PAS domain S-box-containing protein
MTIPTEPDSPVPANEAERLAALRRLRILDTLPQAVFGHVTALAAGICGAPIALITLIDEHRQWVKARQGMDLTETPRNRSFCAHTVLDNDRVLVVPDATRDERFANLEKVRQGEVRFYAGAPIVTPEGHALGAVCVLDRQPRTLDAHQQSMLAHLAGVTLELIQHEAEQREAADRVLTQVQAGEAVIRHVLEQGREMAAFIDPDHRYRLVNPAFELYWVERRDEIVGMRLPDLVGMPVYTRHLRPAIHRAMSGEEVQIEFEQVYPGMGRRHMEVRYGPARDAQGRVTGVVERCRDLTELRQQSGRLATATEALQAKRRLQLQLLQMVSKDLRDPLRAIDEALPALARALPSDADGSAQAGLESVRRGGRRLSQLLDDLQLVAEQDMRELAPEATPVAERVGRALTRLREDLGVGEQARRVQIELPVDLQVRVEPALFELALRALLLHVHRHTDRPGTPLRVAARALEGVAQIEIGVAASAAPLSAAAVGLLADRVVPGDDLDLGLATVRHLAQLHGGALARVDDPGEPLRLVLQLPLA